MIFPKSFYVNELEHDSRIISYQQKIENYIDRKQQLYYIIIKFLDYSSDNYNGITNEMYFQILIKIAESQKIGENRNEMQQFLRIINNISDNHHRNQDFIENVAKILHYYKHKIKRTLTNNEIFNIFKNNKMILFFLLKDGTITISETICNTLLNKIEPNGIRYCYFFYPEIEKFIGEERMKKVKNELLAKYPNIFENYDIKRFKGENDSYICSLIRQDSIEEFISYVNRTNYSLSNSIKPSIFETNKLLTKREQTLIEYAAFYGSIQIFQFLRLNGVDMTESLWIYAIHGNNPEIIHILESSQISPPKSSNNNDKNDDDNSNNFIKCFIESIKCHHNNLADYIEDNLLIQNENDLQQNEKIILKCIKYHNYAYFQTDYINDQIFFYLCFYNYDKLVNFLLKMKENEIEAKIIQYSKNLMRKKFHQKRFNNV